MGSALFSNFAAVDLDRMPSIAHGEVRVHRVPRIAATAESLEGYGRKVHDFARDRVSLVTWPASGWRPIVAGTGNEGGTVEDTFVMERRGVRARGPHMDALYQREGAMDMGEVYMRPLAA